MKTTGRITVVLLVLGIAAYFTASWWWHSNLPF